MKELFKKGMIRQFYTLIIIGMLLVGVFTYYTQYRVTSRDVLIAQGDYAKETASDAISAIQEYPSWRWLLKYWYEHIDKLDAEYDVGYTVESRTKEKSKLLAERHPDFLLKYATVAEIEALPEEDQKLYAEIAYAWIINRFDEIKRNLQADYVYCAIYDKEGGEHPFETLCFLITAADENDTRGTKNEEVFLLGHTVEVTTDTLLKAMHNLAASQEGSKGEYDYSGDYGDYYLFLDTFDNHVAVVAASYSNSELQEVIRRNVWTNTGYALLYEFVLLQIIMVQLYLYGIRPLKNITENIRLYGETKDSATVNNNLKENLKGLKAIAIRQNEIGQLAEDFMDLTQEVDHYVDEIEMITANNQRIQTELSLASEIQKSILPGKFPMFPERKEFDLYASMKPARDVAGDFYDFFLIDEDHLALVIADVSGKGIPAALLMMVATVLVRNNAKMNVSPSAALAATNEALRAHNDQEMFVTVWIGILEISTGKLTCSNAGHEYPVLIHPDGSVELIHDRHGMVLGGMSGVKYPEYELQLKPGSRLFVYTDGITEANNTDHQMFAEERLLRTLNDCADQHPEAIIEEVTASIKAFTGTEEQFDDMTMVCMEYNGTQNKETM